ncbi:MAG: SCO family protein [Thermoleophilia bacterium]|nr:SCO family protein [Thermoleophilia bacterium]
MNRRVLVLIAMLTAGAAGVLAVVVGISASGGDPPGPPGLTQLPAVGTPVTAGTNYDGAEVSFPRDGRPALVTFLFAACPDICPRTAREIAQALDEVGDAAGDIDVVAVSVDPRGDTPAAVRAFLERHDLVGRMDYIVGTRAELVPLWKAWQVAAQPPGKAVSAHSARIVLIDDEGRQVGAYSAGIPISVGDLSAQILQLTGD